MSTSSPDIRRVTNCTKFRLLFWKNWKLQWNRKWEIIVIFGITLLMAGLLFWGNSKYPPEIVEAKKYPPDDLAAVLPVQIVYSPKNDIYEELLKKAKLTFTSKSNGKELEQNLQSNSKLFAGVVFPDDTADIKELPKKLEFSLRFPAEIRSSAFQNWKTHEKFSDFDDIAMAYVKEGFVQLQNAISMAYLQSTGKRTDFPTSIKMQRYPDPKNIVNISLAFLDLVFMIAYVYPGYCIITGVANERETQMKEIMNMLGIQNWLHWLAWFLKSLIVLMGLNIIFVFLFKFKLSDGSVLPYTSWSFLLGLLFVFNIALIFYCFTIAVSFKTTTAAHITYSIIYVIIFVFLRLEVDFFVIDLLLNILPFVALRHLVGYLVKLELEMKGLQWSHLLSNWPKTGLRVWQIFLMMILSIILYLVLFLYIEQINTGEYGIAKKWYFPFQRRFWADLCRKKKTRSSSSREEGGSEQYRLIVLKDPQDAKKNPDENIPGLQIIKLHKRFKDFVAVKELTLDMYVGQITVLLGKNGAGKTTTILMLTGMIAPTSGTAIVNGYDIRTDLKYSRQSLGICPQVDAIFNNLTVKDHITFFCRLRGLWRKNDIKSEVDKFLNIMELVRKKSTLAKKLSGGMKRKLCLCCALAGHAKTVLCDEPSSGVDPAARRRLWQLLQAEKHDRTILLTTHFMDEADALGDRVAILNEGELRCIGSPFDLKKTYGKGYRLICDMHPDCDKDEVTKFLQENSPNITLETVRGTELTYRLSLEDSENYANIFRELEDNTDRLRLTGFGVNMASMEEVFLQVNMTSEQRGSYKKTRKEFNMFEESMIEKRKCRVLLRQLKAIFIKRWLETKRQWISLLLIILLPIVLLLAVLTVVPSKKSISSIPIYITNYDSGIIVLEADDVNSEIAKEYENYAKSFGSSYKFKSTNGKAFENYMLSAMREDDYDAHDYLIGATIGSSELIAWINILPVHAAPLSLNFLHNSLARVFVDPTAEIKVINDPLPFDDIEDEKNSSFAHIAIAIFLLSLTSSVFVIYPIKERVSGLKLQQMLSGINIFTYWLTIFIWDFFTFMIICLGMILLMITFKMDGMDTLLNIICFLLLFIFFALSILPLMYVLSYVSINPGTSFGRSIIINFILCVVCLIIAAIFHYFDTEVRDETSHNYFEFLRLIPHVSAFLGMAHFKEIYDLVIYCNNLDATGHNACREYDSCCDIKPVLGLDPDCMGWDLIYFFISSIILLLILIFLESQFKSFIFNGMCQRNTKKPQLTQEEDVLIENERISNLSKSELKNTPLVVDNISKDFSNLRAVHRLSFVVYHNDCFGLLGVNGAGKSTTFKMLTGDTWITSGEAYFEGYKIRTSLKKPTLRVGYCPQDNVLIEYLTARENFYIYCLLKGVASNQIKSLSNVLALKFGFSDQMNKRAKHLSGGNKRKLCTALALIGNPKIIFLDEPSSGMDPLARHQMWDILIDLRETGKPIVLTSHSMEECEALCTRLAIMVGGQFQCLGSAQYLKNKFAKGLVLKIKMLKQRIQETRGSNIEIEESSINEGAQAKQSTATITEIEKVKQFVAEKFPKAELTEEYQGMLTYQIPFDDIKWSEVFEIMEQNRNELNIGDYTITQTTLDEVFIEFAKNADNK